MRPSPGLILAVLVVLVTAQVVRLVVPGRGPYLWTFLLSAAGLVGGEVIAASGHLNVPAMGVLHPVADVVAIAVLQAVGVVIAGRRSHA
jgi:hypothetical protein